MPSSGRALDTGSPIGVPPLWRVQILTNKSQSAPRLDRHGSPIPASVSTSNCRFDQIGTPVSVSRTVQSINTSRSSHPTGTWSVFERGRLRAGCQGRGQGRSGRVRNGVPGAGGRG